MSTVQVRKKLITFISHDNDVHQSGKINGPIDFIYIFFVNKNHVVLTDSDFIRYHQHYWTFQVENIRTLCL